MLVIYQESLHDARSTKCKLKLRVTFAMNACETFCDWRFYCNNLLTFYT